MMNWKAPLDYRITLGQIVDHLAALFIIKYNREARAVMELDLDQPNASNGSTDMCQGKRPPDTWVRGTFPLTHELAFVLVCRDSGFTLPEPLDGLIV